MFALKQAVKIRNVNCRAELHGDEYKVAVDISVEVKVSNDMLVEFHPSLKPFLFEKDENPAQNELALGDADRLTKLRMPLMGNVKWGWEGEGYELFVEHGVSRDSGVLMIDCKVDHFTFEPLEGGSVSIKFRTIAHPREDDIGKLVSLIQQEVGIELDPPSADKQFEIEERKAAETADIE